MTEKLLFTKTLGTGFGCSGALDGGAAVAAADAHGKEDGGEEARGSAVRTGSTQKGMTGRHREYMFNVSLSNAYMLLVLLYLSTPPMMNLMCFKF